MNIIGQEKTSFIDFPKSICTVYFVEGCNFKCHYCHNAHIVNGEEEKISEDKIFDYLNKRKKFLDGVCISGGEPTIYKDLPSFIEKIKQLGYRVKLDTNGTNSDMVHKLISERYIDYIAMDVKAPLDKYNEIANSKVNISEIQNSIDIIMNGSIDYEFRTTLCRELLLEEDILEIANMIKGAKLYYLQNYKYRDSVLNKNIKMTSYNQEELEGFREMIKDYIKEVKIRG